MQKPKDFGIGKALMNFGNNFGQQQAIVRKKTVAAVEIIDNAVKDIVAPT